MSISGEQWFHAMGWGNAPDIHLADPQAAVFNPEAFNPFADKIGEKAVKVRVQMKTIRNDGSVWEGPWTMATDVESVIGNIFARNVDDGGAAPVSPTIIQDAVKTYLTMYPDLNTPLASMQAAQADMLLQMARSINPNLPK